MARASQSASNIGEEMAYQDIAGVGDGCHDSSGDHQLFPGLSQVDDMDAFMVALVDVRGHEICAVLCSNMGVCGDHECHIFFFGFGICEVLSEAHFLKEFC